MIVIWAVVVWGAAIALRRASSARCGWPPRCSRSRARPTASAPSAARSINQTVTPDAMRGRMSSVFSLVVTSGPRLGDVESGTVAGLTSARFSVVSGGLACIAGVASSSPPSRRCALRRRGGPAAQARRSPAPAPVG